MLEPETEMMESENESETEKTGVNYITLKSFSVNFLPHSRQKCGFSSKTSLQLQ